MSGKTLRLKRFIAAHDGRIVILPLDHGLSCGPIPGLLRMEQAVAMGVRGGADALVLHKGMLRCLDSLPGPLPGIFLHLSGSTQLGPDFHRKVLVATVEEAIRRGADGVSVHINLGDAHEAQMLRDLGAVGDACAVWQIPLLVMIYVRGAHAPAPVPDSAIAHAARVAAELGADIIKIPAPGDDRALADIARGSLAPLVLAGGSKVDDPGVFLRRIESALQAGFRGVAVGRNVFQHQHPEAPLRIIHRMVHDGLAAAEALAQLEAASPTKDRG